MFSLCSFPVLARRLSLPLAVLVLWGCATPETPTGEKATGVTPSTTTESPTHHAARGGPPANGAAAKSGPGSYLAGLHAERAGQSGEAGDFLLRALESDPENLDLLTRACLLMLDEGRFEESAAMARRIVALSPGMPLPTLNLAIEEVRAGNLTQAEHTLRGMSDQGLNRYFRPLMLSWVQAGMGDPDMAIATLGPLAENSGFSVLRDLHVALISDMAGRMVPAEEFYNSALAAGEPTSYRLVQVFGNFFERIGRKERAEALYKNYVEKSNDDLFADTLSAGLKAGGAPERLVNDVAGGMAEGLFNIASALRQESADQMALLYARLAQRLQPDFPLIQLLVAEILEATARPEKAIAVYETLAPDTPYRWMADMKSALILDQLGRSDEAVALLKKLSKQKPTRWDVLITLGDILRAHEKFTEAVAAYDQALNILPVLEERHWSLLYARGIALERSSQWARAETDFLRALELLPNQPYVLNYLGYSWVEQGINLEKARAMIEKAVALKPDDGYIVDSLGWALYRMGDFPAAVRELERAVEIRPQDITINEHLGDVYWRVGRTNEARFQWQRALTLNPDTKQTKAINEKLANGLPDGAADSGGTP